MNLSGLLFFPVTPFTRTDTVDVDVLDQHIRHCLGFGPGAVFAACGTGEFHCLSPAEHRAVAAQAVASVDGAVPVIVGCGGSVASAREQARAAEEAGADGLLLLPPYLVNGPKPGLADYVRVVARATSLPVIAYSRSTGVFDVPSALEIAVIPNVVGIKDGHGDLAEFRAIVEAVRARRPDFQFFDGLPTAEVSMPEYQRFGVDLYSSAAFAFVPEVAMSYYRALQSRVWDRIAELDEAFYRPLVTLRDQVPGYLISLVKAGVALRGLPAGPVRAPLVAPTPAHLAQLSQIIDAGLKIADQGLIGERVG